MIICDILSTIALRIILLANMYILRINLTVFLSFRYILKDNILNNILEVL